MRKLTPKEIGDVMRKLTPKEIAEQMDDDNTINERIDYPQLKSSSYTVIPSAKLSLHNNELFIEGPLGSTTIQLDDHQLYRLKVDFMHMLGGA
jgi:hypothetical protein